MSGGIGMARTVPAATAMMGAGPVSASRHIPGATGWLALETLPESVQAARRFTNSVLGAWDVGDSDADNIVLVVAELVTNAIQAVQKADATDAQPGARVLLRLRNDGGLIAVEVADSAPRMPAPKPPATDDDENGRGLLIVGMLCETWDCYQRPGAGKVVLAMVRTKAAGA
jgi:anti-sigma regulatory factor (Ser/Thr protein kinase)